MRKSTLFVSAVLTTFALVMLYGVVSSYQNAKNVAEVAAVQPTATLVPEPTEIPATPTQSFILPEDAAKIAAQVVGHDNLLSAESSSFNGVDAYLITFTNKDVVYVGLDGQILSVQIAPVVVVNVAPPAKKNNNSSNNNQSNSSGGESEHEDHDD